MARYSRLSMAAGLAVMGLVLAAGAAEAAHLYRVPALDSPAYWDSHEIGVVEITSVKPSGGLNPDVEIKTLSVIAANPWPKLDALPVRILYAGSGIPPDLSVGERLILCLPHPDSKDERDVAMVFAIDKEGKPVQKSSGPAMNDVFFEPPPATFTLGACNQIARIRKLPDALDAFREATVAKEPLALQYAIHRLETLNRPADVAVAVDQLDRVRQDEAQPLDTRVLASQVLNTIQGHTGAASDHWKWACAAVENSRKMEDGDLRSLLLVVVSDKAHRVEAADFVVRLAQDPKVRLPLRRQALGAMSMTNNIYPGLSSDPLCVKLLDAVLSLLKDKEPEMRMAAAYEVQRMVRGLSRAPTVIAPPEASLGGIHRLIVPLVVAAGVEKDAKVKTVLDAAVKEAVAAEGAVRKPVEDAAAQAEVVVIATATNIRQLQDNLDLFAMDLEITDTLKGTAPGKTVKAKADARMAELSGIREKASFVFFLAGKQKDYVVFMLPATEGTLPLIKQALPPVPAGGVAPK